MTRDLRQTLADNINGLIDQHAVDNRAKRSLRAWALHHRLEVRVVQRVAAGENITIDTLQEFAEALSVEPSDLLKPGLGSPRSDPGAAQVEIGTLSTLALEAARLIDSQPTAEARKAAHQLLLKSLKYQLTPLDFEVVRLMHRVPEGVARDSVYATLVKLVEYKRFGSFVAELDAYYDRLSKLDPDYGAEESLSEDITALHQPGLSADSTSMRTSLDVASRSVSKHAAPKKAKS